MTAQQLVGAAALVQAMRRDGNGPTAGDPAGGGEPTRLKGDIPDAGSDPLRGPATPARVLYAAAE